jgi:hypothetical protein
MVDEAKKSLDRAWRKRETRAGIKQSTGAGNRGVVLVPTRQPMYPGGPVRQPYSYSVPGPHRLF